MSFASKAKELAIEASKMAKQSKKTSCFTIGTTKNVKNKTVFFPPFRYSPRVVCANVMVYSKTEAVEIIKAVDGIVDVILVDAEEKMKGLEDLVNIVRSEARKSRILTFKANDLTADSADALLAQYMPNIHGKRVSIIGAGNLGSKIALKLLERGGNVVITGTNKEKIKKISDGLNSIKSEASKSKIIGMTENLEACRNADVIISSTPGIPIVTAEMVNSMNMNGIIIDAGIGTITPEAISSANKKGIRILRLDMRAGFAGSLTTIFETENFIEKILGSREIGGVRIIAGGIIGKEGDVVVDNISNPTKVIGIADGRGGLISSNVPEEFLKKLEKIRKEIGGIKLP